MFASCVKHIALLYSTTDSNKHAIIHPPQSTAYYAMDIKFILVAVQCDSTMAGQFQFHSIAHCE